MRTRIHRSSKWIALTIVLVLFGGGCASSSNESTASSPTAFPSSVPTQGASPAPTSEQTITPTMAAVPIKVPALPKGVLYQDDFTDPKSGWPALEFGNYYVGYHEPNHYHVEVHAPNDREIVPVPKKSFGDFTVETKVLVSSSNTAQTGDFRYGLVFRRSGNQYYAFVISPRTKTWYVLKSSPTGLAVLKQGTNDSIQGLQADDILRVDAKGSDFIFHINDQPVGQVSDSDYANGEVGFYVETFDSPRVHIHYGNITIREVETTTSAKPTVMPTRRPSATPTPTPSGALDFDWAIESQGPNPTNSTEWQIVVDILARGGDGNYQYFHDGLPVDGPRIRIVSRACAGKPGSFWVQDGTGQVVRKDYYLGSPYCK